MTTDKTQRRITRATKTGGAAAIPAQSEEQGESNQTQAKRATRVEPQLDPLTDTISLRRDRRAIRDHQADVLLPTVPRSVSGRVLCAHPELVTGCLAVALGLTFLLPRDFLTGLALICALIFAVGWPNLLRLPSMTHSAVLLSICAVFITVSARILADLAMVGQAVGICVIAAFITEMIRNPRPRLAQSISGGITGIMVLSTGGVWALMGRNDLWHFILIPAAVTLLGGCLGMAISANWPPQWRAVSATLTSLIFGLGTGGAVMFFSDQAQQQTVVFAGGYLPPLWAALGSGALLGIVVGLMFGAMTNLFSGDTGPTTVRAALVLSTMPLLATAIPVYVVARLLVGSTHALMP